MNKHKLDNDTVKVFGGIDRAIRILKKNMQRYGTFGVLSNRRNCPGVQARRRLKDTRATKRAIKASDNV